jgi:hypothetical protein
MPDRDKAIDLCKSKEAKSRISETHSHVRELIIHGQTDTIEFTTFYP